VAHPPATIALGLVSHTNAGKTTLARTLLGRAGIPSVVAFGPVAGEQEAARAVVEAAGASLNAVVRCTIYLADLNDFGAVNEVYGTYFTPPAPARATVEVARLPRDARIEIDAIALL